MRARSADSWLLAVLNLSPPRKKTSGATAGTISLELKEVDLVSNVEADVEALRRTVQGSGIANTGNSSILVHVDEGSQLAKGSDIYKSIGNILSKLDPIKNVIDDVSRVSRLFRFPVQTLNMC